MLGGNASSEIQMHMVGADGMRGEALCVEARETGIIEEVRLEDCVTNPQRSPSLLDLVFYDKVRNEPNIELFLNTTVHACEKEGSRIAKVHARRDSTEETFSFTAKIFVDCTGDGRLGAEAGAPFTMGREGSKCHGESLAENELPDKQTLGSTILYRARLHDQPMPFKAPSWARKFTAEDLKLRLRPDPNEPDRALEYGFWWAEWGGRLNTIGDNEAIRDELLAIVFGIWDHIKNSGAYPGVENWAIEWFGWVPGKRESRRFEGLYQLTQSDIWEGLPMADAIAYGGWPIDTHPPGGIDAVDESPCRQTLSPYLFDIPLRACVCATIPNLMFAGRNISATHIAFASTRVMATCAVMGEGVGVAAAHAIQQGIQPAELPGNQEHMQHIQQHLLKNDAFLIGVTNEDLLDLAKQSRIRASSEASGYSACEVISGQTRSVHGKHGARTGRANPGTHRWISAPDAALPAWVELSWEKPVEISEVRIIFDTGLHRRMTLTQSDVFLNKMHWGSPQPETVRDYQLFAFQADGTEVSLIEVKGNYQRQRIHRLGKPVLLQKMRLQVTATNGIAEARICEIRVYT